MKLEVRFRSGMACCKSTRDSLGMACSRPIQMCCAWHHACRIGADKGPRGLSAFATHLLGIWPLSEVFWVFFAAGQISTLAQICCDRWAQLPDSSSRSAYRSEIEAATLVYRIGTGHDSQGAFLATFDVLCEAASVRS